MASTMHITLLPAAAVRVEALMKKTESPNAEPVVGNALRLYEHVIDLTEKGNKFYTKNADGEMVPFNPF